MALVNPLQVFRTASMVLFDSQLVLLGPSAYVILDQFGEAGYIAWALVYPGVLGLCGIVLGWGYSAPPLNLNSRGLGEVSVLAGFGLLPLVTYLVQTGALSWTLLLASLPVGLLTANLLYINQFPDRQADIQAHKLHWVARLSPYVARWGYVLIALLAWLTLPVLIVSGVLPVLASISALPVVLSIKAARILLRHAAATPQKLAPAIELTILAVLSHGALLTLALVMASFVTI